MVLIIFPLVIWMPIFIKILKYWKIVLIYKLKRTGKRSYPCLTPLFT